MVHCTWDPPFEIAHMGSSFWDFIVATHGAQLYEYILRTWYPSFEITTWDQPLEIIRDPPLGTTT